MRAHSLNSKNVLENKQERGARAGSQPKHFDRSGSGARRMPSPCVPKLVLPLTLLQSRARKRAKQVRGGKE